ncbi:MAG TPA: acyl-CoA dehydrogenase family protein [Chloroflexota bacterium]|nr:acyl-CoA dehydrogenase family protein [Chloroflexota bacterium]
MDFGLTQEQKLILETVKDFTRTELMPLEEEMRKAELEGWGDQFPDAQTTNRLRLKAKDLGLWGLDTPEEYGGLNLGTVMMALISIEVSHCLVPFRFGGSADNILYAGNEEQKKEYLIPTINGERKSCFAITEPTAGSDATNIRMTATRDASGDWILNGEKIFITGGNEADFAIVFAVTDKEKGYRGGITAFLVDRAMGWTSRYVPTMGSWGPARLLFDNVRVPNRNVLGEVGWGFRLAMQWIGAGRVLIPARAVGQAERLLQIGLDYARQRVAFGHPIAEYQAIQWMLADSAVEIQSTKWLTFHAAWKQDQGLDNRHEASMAKLHGAQMVNQVADRVLQIHGGMGYTKELPIERLYREVRLYRIYEGTDEIQKRSIAGNLIQGRVRIGEWD